jgi:hypothetical protein
MGNKHETQKPLKLKKNRNKTVKRIKEVNDLIKKIKLEQKN